MAQGKSKFTGTEIIDKVCVPMANAKVAELDEIQVLMMFNMTTNTEEEAEKIWKRTVVDAKREGIQGIDFIYKIFTSRLEAFKEYVELDFRLRVFLSLTVLKTPGQSSLYVPYLIYLLRKKSFKKMTIENYANFFPNGFPADDELTRIWDGQKTPNGLNYVDQMEAYEVLLASALQPHEHEHQGSPAYHLHRQQGHPVGAAESSASLETSQ